MNSGLVFRFVANLFSKILVHDAFTSVAFKFQKNNKTSLLHMQWLSDLLEALSKIDLNPNIWRSQNLFYLLMRDYQKGFNSFSNEKIKFAFERLGRVLNVQI